MSTSSASEGIGPERLAALLRAGLPKSHVHGAAAFEAAGALGTLGSALAKLNAVEVDSLSADELHDHLKGRARLRRQRGIRSVAPRRVGPKPIMAG